MLSNEEWKGLGFLGFPLYSISTLGRVKRNDSNKILLQSKTRSNYLQVSLYNGHGRVKHCRVSRLVALAFLEGHRSNVSDEVHHINEDKEDNSVSNLMWLSHTSNCRASILGRKVYKLSIYGEVVMVYDYLIDASKDAECSPSTIRKHCKNGKLYKGFKWSFDKLNNN